MPIRNDARLARKFRHRRRIFAPAMPVIVKMEQRYRRKGEIIGCQRPPRVAVRFRPYPSVAVCHRSPVFTAVGTLR